MNRWKCKMGKKKGRCLKTSKLELNKTSHVLKWTARWSALMEHGQYLQLYQCHFSTNISKWERSEMKTITGWKQFAFAEMLPVVLMPNSVLSVFWQSRQRGNSATNTRLLAKIPALCGEVHFPMYKQTAQIGQSLTDKQISCPSYMFY